MAILEEGYGVFKRDRTGDLLRRGSGDCSCYQLHHLPGCCKHWFVLELSTKYEKLLAKRVGEVVSIVYHLEWVTVGIYARLSVQRLIEVFSVRSVIEWNL